MTFAPPDSVEYRTVIEKNHRLKMVFCIKINNFKFVLKPVIAVAYAEDILCSVDKLIMVPSFTSGINYKVGVVYKANITRF